MKALCADSKGEFLSIKLRTFCEKKGITLKYEVSYMHEENGLAEKA